MKALLIILLLLSTLAFSQKNNKYNVSDLVKISVHNNDVSVEVLNFSKKIIVNYYLKGNRNVFVTSEYINMKGFNETHTLPKGVYVIEVIKDGIKNIKTFKVG